MLNLISMMSTTNFVNQRGGGMFRRLLNCQIKKYECNLHLSCSVNTVELKPTTAQTISIMTYPEITSP